MRDPRMEAAYSAATKALDEAGLAPGWLDGLVRAAVEAVDAYDAVNASDRAKLWRTSRRLAKRLTGEGRML